MATLRTRGRFRDSPCFPCGRHLPLPFPETYAKDRACLLVKNVRVRISLDYRLVNSRVTGLISRPMGIDNMVIIDNRVKFIGPCVDCYERNCFRVTNNHDMLQIELRNRAQNDSEADNEWNPAAHLDFRTTLEFLSHSGLSAGDARTRHTRALTSTTSYH